MSYQTGTSTGPTDLLSKLKTFLEADGWTTNDYSAVGAGYRLHVEKTPSSGGETMYFNFRSAIAETGTTLIAPNNDGSTNGTVTSGILVNSSTGYNAGELWHSQPGYPQDPTDGNKGFAGCMNPMSISAIPAYYFFSVNDTVNVAVEVTSGKFQFMSFGMLEKQGVYTGGQFFSASFDSQVPYYNYYTTSWYMPGYFTARVLRAPTGAVYLDADSDARWRAADYNEDLCFPCVAGQTANETDSQSGMAAFFWSKSPNFYNNIAAMCPIYTFVKRSDDNFSLLGWPSGVRFLNVTHYSVGQEITYGPETWKVFPANDVTGSAETVKNENCGFAFKKVA